MVINAFILQETKEQNGPLDQQPGQELNSIAPVLNMLDTWGAEAPFSKFSETAVGGSVLAVN